MFARRIATLAAVAVGALGACAHGPQPAPPPLLSPAVASTVAARPTPPAADAADGRAAVLRRIRALLAGEAPVSHGMRFERDPVGCVQAAYWEAGIDLFDAEVAADSEADGMAVLYRSAAARQWLHRQTPRPGDIVFFDAQPRGTALYPAQAAVVESVGQDGTLQAVGCFSDGPRRVAMNLRHPDDETGPTGRPINDLLAGRTRTTSARLFRSFADPFSGR